MVCSQCGSLPPVKTALLRDTRGRLWCATCRARLPDRRAYHKALWGSVEPAPPTPADHEWWQQTRAERP